MTEFLQGLGYLAATFCGGMALSAGVYFGWRGAAILFGPIGSNTTTTANVRLPVIEIVHRESRG